MPQLPNKHAFTYRGKPYDFGMLKRNWNREAERMMPVIGQTAVNFFQDRFRAQAWTDRRAERWDPRKRKDKNPSRRALLIRSGRMRNSINMASFSRRQVVISTPLKYAAAHNFGVDETVKVREHTRRVKGRVVMSDLATRKSRTKTVTTGSHRVRAHTRKMKLPQRQFMGNSHALSMKFERIVIKAIHKIPKQ
jgi:phage gpG-like protein